MQECWARVLDHPKPVMPWRSCAEVYARVAQHTIAEQVRGTLGHVSVRFVDDLQARETFSRIFASWVLVISDSPRTPSVLE